MGNPLNHVIPPRASYASFRAVEEITEFDMESPRGNLATSQARFDQTETYQDAFADLLTQLRNYISAQHDALK